jgi:HAE1 family hydrophobic/amphiphilic exporter-1
MALGIGEGSELQEPMARVVIGGLISSTLITLVLIPVIYSILEVRSERRAARPVHLDRVPEPQLQSGD